MALPNSNLLVSGTGAVFIQNLAIQGNSIIATNENGNIDFVPNGSGVIGFGNVGFNIGVISTTLENQDLTLNPDGNGNILLSPYGPGSVGIGTNTPSETLDLVGTFEQQDVLTRFIRKSLPSVGAPFNGLKGYILLAKAATPTSVNMAASYVVGKIIFKNGNTTTESFTEVFNVASSRGYDKENFSISIEHNGYGSGNSRFNRLVKCTYDSVEYHAIETSSVGSSNSHEQTFEGYAVDAGLLFVDENYVIAVSDYGNIGIVSNGDSNIGVGTVSTTAHFDIGTNDDGRIQAILTRGNDADFQLQALNSSSSNASGAIVSKFGVRHGTNESVLFNFIRGNFGNDGSLAIVTDNAERVRVDSAGNVGIGTSSPRTKFQVNSPVDAFYSNTSGQSVEIYGSAATIAPNYSTGDHNATVMINSTNAYAQNVGASIALGGRSYPWGGGAQPHTTYAKISGVQQPGLNNYYGNFVVETLYANTGSLREAMRIDGDGNVGIGISSPAAKLDVGGSDTNGRALQLRSGDNSNDTDSAQIIFSYSNSSYDNGGYAHSIRTRHNGSAASANAIDFWLWNHGVDTINTLGSLRVMTLDGTGNVGIGTTSPQAKLHLYKSEDTTSVIYPLRIEAHTDANNVSDGNSGVGMEFIANRGSTAQQLASQIYSQIYSGAGTTGDHWSLNFNVRADDTLYTAMTIAAVGGYANPGANVGIGTTSPTEKLDVAGTLRHQGLTLNEGTTPNVDEIKTFTKTLSVSTSWIDTGIIGTDLSDGSYVVQLFDNINSGLGHWSMIFTGIMSWYSSNVTGDTAYNEILLHNAGHAVNGNPLFLRTQMQNTPAYLKLQIRCATGSGSGNFTLKFRRMI